jgi:isochorismate hydrolase
VSNARLLLRAARELDLPLVLTTQYARGLGPTVPEIAELLQGVVALDKTCFGCFGDERFGQLLAERAAGRRSLLVIGIETHICVLQTVLGALARDYTVHVPTDAVSARSPNDHQRGLDRMAAAGAVLSTVEMAVYELLGASGTEAFKALLPWLKDRP